MRGLPNATCTQACIEDSPAAAARDPGVADGLTLLDLPEELLRRIVGRVDSHRELDNLACTCIAFQRLCSQPSVWRELCFRVFEFKAVRVAGALPPLAHM